MVWAPGGSISHCFLRVEEEAAESVASASMLEPDRVLVVCMYIRMWRNKQDN
jgi:hypothetical protein